MLAKAVPGEKLRTNLFSHLPMFYRAPSVPQLKPDTYPTFDLLYVTESAEIGVHNVTEGNRKTTFSPILRKSKDWLSRNQNNVSDMSTRGLLFQ